MSDYIPQELLIRILERLPIKPLVRFTAVCKLWLSLITNPNFTSRSPKNDLILVHSGSQERNEEHNSLHYDDEEFGEYLKLPVHFASSHLNYRIVGSYDGVICLADDDRTYNPGITLWNPSIRKMVETTPPIVPTNGSLYMHVIGFGFDLLTNDYKIVRIVYLDDDDNDPLRPIVDVYGLSTGAWRNIGDRLDPILTMIHEKSPQAYANGIVHWVGYQQEEAYDGCLSRRNSIVTFHMGNEVLDELKFPSSLKGKFDFNDQFFITIYKDHLALVENNLENDMSSISIWVMGEYGLAGTWSKLFNINLNGVFTTLAGFRRNGDCILGSKRGYLVSYDSTTGTTKDIGMSYGRSFAELYTESIVLLGNKGTKSTERRKRAKEIKLNRIVDRVENPKQGNKRRKLLKE